MTDGGGWTLRAATPEDVERIAQIWHAGWRDGHLGHVPDALVPHRRLEHFRGRVPPRLPTTTVAAAAAELLGFVTIHDAEVEQLFVDAAARGTGVAAALLRHAEATIAGRFDTAWLAVVEGNGRARRFYERCGWRDTGGFDYMAEVEGGRLPVPSRRYEKSLRPAS
jgi:GNAT superfamily N-acetyltransferase